VFTYTRELNAKSGSCVDNPNTASFEAHAVSLTTLNDVWVTTPGSTTGSDGPVTVRVCVGADLTVSKTATPYFTRTYKWKISKSVDKTLVEQIGSTATFTFTINASQDGLPTDSAWTVKGLITVTNPNDWEDVTVSLQDAIDNGGACTFDVSSNSSLTVAKGTSKDVAYTCTYASAPSPANFKNTATATWDPAKYYTPASTGGTASGSATGAFGTPTTIVNDKVTVNDLLNGTTTTLGTLTGSTTTPVSGSWPDVLTVPVPTKDCVSYTNTAKIVETGQSDSKTVKVCGVSNSGALTMGFWQNKNGQAIITGGASTGGVCNSATWLRGYAPFQDLSATASCSAVGTYVTNVIKAANASGAAMNAMLKGQMLATALDVYFSSSSLGGVKISAPDGPIGAITIDLTKICKMIDGTGGTATCGGTYYNTSAAFGGASSLTVSQILSYAASQSNAGGSAWYGQVKATQELAKNTFDAINNGVAFAP
jgi:hypothetical protein